MCDQNKLSGSTSDTMAVSGMQMLIATPPKYAVLQVIRFVNRRENGCNLEAPLKSAQRGLECPHPRDVIFLLGVQNSHQADHR